MKDILNSCIQHSKLHVCLSSSVTADNFIIHSPHPIKCNVRKHNSQWIIQATFNSQWHQITAVQYYILGPAITSVIPIIRRNEYKVASLEESKEWHTIKRILPSQNMNLNFHNILEISSDLSSKYFARQYKNFCLSELLFQFIKQYDFSALTALYKILGITGETQREIINKEHGCYWGQSKQGK